MDQQTLRRKYYRRGVCSCQEGVQRIRFPDGEGLPQSLRSEVGVLVDIFKYFRDTSIVNYQLVPAQNFTSPRLFYSAALKKYGFQLDLLSNPDMLLMFEQQTGAAEVKYPYMSNYDPVHESPWKTLPILTRI